jgi:L-proline amide hydrolase
MTARPSAKGTVAFREFATWYRVSGELAAGRTTLVVIHGGPGSTHDYLVSLADLAQSGMPVVHYDQLGNGGSTHLTDRAPEFWTIGLFLDELDNLLTKLRIAGNYLLYGHSWGGFLAARHAASRPAGLRGLIIADAPASYPLWLTELDALRAQLPPEVNQTLRRHERAGTTDSDEYHQASAVFYARHLCRLTPWPREYQASFFDMYNNPAVYYAMNGPSEFYLTGSLATASVTDCIATITVPTLLIRGRYDEVTDGAVRPFLDLIPDIRAEIFENSSHVPHLEEPGRFREVMSRYLRTVTDS